MGNSSATGDVINETLHGFVYRVAVINETVEGSNNRDDVINNNVQDINDRVNVMNKYAKILTICAHRINFSLHDSFDGVTAMPIPSAHVKWLLRAVGLADNGIIEERRNRFTESLLTSQISPTTVHLSPQMNQSIYTFPQLLALSFIAENNGNPGSRGEGGDSNAEFASRRRSDSLWGRLWGQGDLG